MGIAQPLPVWRHGGPLFNVNYQPSAGPFGPPPQFTADIRSRSAGANRRRDVLPYCSAAGVTAPDVLPLSVMWLLPSVLMSEPVPNLNHP